MFYDAFKPLEQMEVCEIVTATKRSCKRISVT